MLVGRVIQGAAGGIFPLAFGIIRDEFPRERVAGGIGLMSALLGVGGGAGRRPRRADRRQPLLPLPLLAAADPDRRWRRCSRTSSSRSRRCACRAGSTGSGAALMSVGLVLVLLAVSQSRAGTGCRRRRSVCLAAGLVVLALWVRSETRSRQPLVDMRMMRIRGVWTTNTVALLLGFGMYATFFLVPQFVQTATEHGYGFGASVTKAGLFLLPSTIAMLSSARRPAGSSGGSARSRRCSPAALLVLRRSAPRVRADSSSGRSTSRCALLGSGIGLAFAAMANLIIENVGPGETGVATGMNTVTRTVGGALRRRRDRVACSRARSCAAACRPRTATRTRSPLCAVALVAGVLVGFAIPQRRPEAAFAPHRGRRPRLEHRACVLSSLPPSPPAPSPVPQLRALRPSARCRRRRSSGSRPRAARSSRSRCRSDRAGTSGGSRGPTDGHVLREVTEGDVGSTVVIVFRAVGPGTTTVVLAETRGETAKAYRAARYAVTVT